MDKVRRYLSHINLATATWTGDSEMLGIPSYLQEMVLLAIEDICGRNGLGMHGAELEVLAFEAALDTALRPVGQYLSWAREEDYEAAESAYQQGRIWGAISGSMFPGNANLEDEATLEALLLYQLDRLLDAHQKQDIERALHLFVDICGIQTLIAEIKIEKDIATHNDFKKIEAARSRGKLRHKDTTEQKGPALAEWDANGQKYSSAASFARHRHKTYGITERTLYGWVRDHRKTNI